MGQQFRVSPAFLSEFSQERNFPRRREKAKWAISRGLGANSAGQKPPSKESRFLEDRLDT
tara:strand:+ start:212 stop:391 length:180 start_codon:yes stop_codon:yes gene_type:complete